MKYENDQPISIPFAFPGLDRIQCRFTTRFGAHRNGTGDYRTQVRARLTAPSWVDMEQVHGTDIAFISGPDRQYTAETRPVADALATAVPHQALVVSVADCQPLLLAHVTGRFIAALHVGWRANRADAPGMWVKQICDAYRAVPQEIMAVRGPSLGPGWSEFTHFTTEWGSHFTHYYHPATQTVDLWQMTRNQLLQAGLYLHNIFSLDLCTYSLPQLFYSYRRDKTVGRQAGIIWIT